MGRGSREKAKAKDKGQKQQQKAKTPFNIPTPEPTPEPTEETPTPEPPEETDNESLKSLKSISPAMRKKPLDDKITPREEEETTEPETETKAEETKAEEAKAEETKAEETKAEETKIIPIKEETKITTYKDIFKTIEDFYEQNKGIEETFTKLESVINNMSDKMFDETFETVAEGIFNTTINGKKVFNTLEDAKKFIYEIRYNGKRGFRGQNTLKYKLPKKLQEGLQQEKQEKQQLTTMMQRNIKQVPSSKYIYQY